MRECDKNTRFFHECVNQRRKTNIIKKIRSENGQEFTLTENMVDQFQNYFQDLFSTSNPMGVNECLRTLQVSVTKDMNGKLLKKFIAQEVEEAAFQMNPLS